METAAVQDERLVEKAAAALKHQKEQRFPGRSNHHHIRGR